MQADFKLKITLNYSRKFQIYLVSVSSIQSIAEQQNVVKILNLLSFFKIIMRETLQNLNSLSLLKC